MIYVGGLSKTLSSSLRIGYLAASKSLVKNLVDVKVLTSLGGSRFERSRRDEPARAVAPTGSIWNACASRARRALESPPQQLEACGWDVFGEPSGGNFVWAKVPGIDDSAVLVGGSAEVRHHARAGQLLPAERRSLPVGAHQFGVHRRSGAQRCFFEHMGARARTTRPAPVR